MKNRIAAYFSEKEKRHVRQRIPHHVSADIREMIERDWKIEMLEPVLSQENDGKYWIVAFNTEYHPAEWFFPVGYDTDEALCIDIGLRNIDPSVVELYSKPPLWVTPSVEAPQNTWFTWEKIRLSFLVLALITFMLFTVALLVN